MAIGKELTQAVVFTLARWDREAAIYFCRLASKGADFQQVMYPTGLTKIRASLGAEHAEVSPEAAEQLRANGYKIA